MKKTLILLALSISSFLLHSQATKVTDNVYTSLGFEIKDNIVYASVSGSCVITFNLNTPNSKSCIINNNISNYPIGTFLNGSDLYVVGGGQSNLFKLDLAQTNSTHELILENLDEPKDVLLKGNLLYIAEKNKITSININDANKTKSIINDNVNPIGFAMHNDEIYFFETDKIAKLNNDNSTKTVISNISPLAIEIIDDYMFYSELNSISEVNLSNDESIEKSTLISANNVRAMKVYKTDLYFTEYDSNAFYKYSLEGYSLSQKTFNKSYNYISIYQKMRKVYIINDNNLSYNLYDINGKIKIKNSKSKIIDLDKINLKSGVYILNFENKKTIKFVIE